MPAPDAPGRDCPHCPRLAAFRQANRAAQPDWHNAPVESAGPLSARLLVAGLAPGMRGANRTGRPFTGDFAGDLLYATLREFGFTSGVYGRAADDGVSFEDCRITNAVRCVPPQNKPTGAEIAYPDYSQEDQDNWRFLFERQMAMLPGRAGAAYLVLGSSSGISDMSLSSADAKLTGEAGGDKAGISVSTAGDVNNEGYADVLVGADGEDTGSS